jgi:hypothetical protein
LQKFLTKKISENSLSGGECKVANQAPDGDSNFFVKLEI